MAFTVEPPLFLPYGKQVAWTYSIHGTGTQLEALAALAAFSAPISIFGSVRQDFSLTRLIGFYNNEVWYEGQVSYGPAAQADAPNQSAAEGSTGPGSRDPGWRLIGFQGGVTTEHVTQSDAAIARFPSTAHNYRGAIGVTSEGVTGCDKWVKTLAFTLQKRIPFSDLSDAWIRAKLEPTQLCYNYATWRGFAAGEVLFYTYDGQAEGNELVITAQFLHEKNITGKTVGAIAGITKKGWEWSWTRHVEIETASKREVRPHAVYIEQLYGPADFSVLGE